MAKGGGKQKGRPRKELISQHQLDNQSTVDAGTSGSAMEELANNGTMESLRDKIKLEIKSSVEKQSEIMQAEGEKEAITMKIEEMEEPPLCKRGMSLGYIAPTLKNGKPTATLCVTELEKAAEVWKNSVVFYVIGEAPTISYLRVFLQKQCGVQGGVEIFYHNEGYFIIRFELRKEKDRMLMEGPYTLANRPIIVKEWTTDFCFEKEVLREVPLWIRLPKLPLNCWSGDSLSRIDSVLGKPICADECTSLQKRISYARMLVEVDITKPLIYKIQIEGEQVVMVEQQVYYEWVPIYCQVCHKVGHICMKKQEVAGIQKKQWQVKEKSQELDKGKAVMVDKEPPTEEWIVPKKVVAPTFQVGEVHVTTRNGYQKLDQVLGVEGGDRFPFHAS